MISLSFACFEARMKWVPRKVALSFACFEVKYKGAVSIILRPLSFACFEDKLTPLGEAALALSFACFEDVAR